MRLTLSAVICLAIVAECATIRFSTEWTEPGGVTRAIHGVKPEATSSNPLFVFTTGTYCSFATDADFQFLTRMAELGYTSAQVEYRNSDYPLTSEALLERAKGIYGDGSTSAFSVLCAREDVDCDKGIAVMGFSQGSNLASIAAFYDNRVSAAFLYAGGTQAFALNDFSPVLNYMYNGQRNPYHHLDRTRVLQLIGENDEIFGCSLDGPCSGRDNIRKQQSDTSGYDCPTGYDCLQVNSSGFYVVANSMAQEGGAMAATHCDTMYNPGECCEVLNTKFADPSNDSPYSFNFVMEWLARNGRLPASNEDIPFSDQDESAGARIEYPLVAVLVLSLIWL